MKHCGTRQLETERLILRRFVKEDADAMYRNWASDDEVTKYLTWPTHSNVKISQMVINDWVNSYSDKSFYQWAVVWKEKGEPIGSISVVEIKEDTSTVHIGYCIGKEWWHKGITSEALTAVMDFLFKEAEVNRIEARHDPRNPNSGKVMKKCGMKYEGTLRSADRNNQGLCDACYYAMLKSERKGNLQMQYEIIRLTDKPQMKEQAAEWFHEKWGIPVEAYRESMEECLAGKKAVPAWYMALQDNRIIGGLGVIENDFHDRKDLTPNVCAVYTEEDRRCCGVAGALLGYVCADMKEKGIDTLYLVTDHTSFYERYGWKFLCMVQGEGEPDMTRMYIHKEQTKAEEA